ncbi:MAG: hypothetical protein ACIAXF_07310 [Phycisphaerales bacterium JB063]
MPTTEDNPHRCALCQRAGVALTRHHLIPRKRHRQPSCKKRFNHTERTQRIAMLCRPCHSTIHATLTEKQLEQHFNTLDDLAGHPDIARFVAWVRKQKPGRRIAIRRPSAR